MLLKKFSFYLLFLLFHSNLYAQTLIHVPSQNYSDVDDYVKTLSDNKYTTIDSVAVDLASFQKGHLKLRAVYSWVTSTISLDVTGNKKTRKAVENVDDILRQKKATALGYANLVKALCEKLNMPCEVVAGYVKSSATRPGTVLKSPNHYWNIVRIYNKWYLLDAALGSGTLDKKGKSFIRKYNDSYFVVNPRQMILNHLPVKSDKQFLDTLVDKSTFFNYPPVYDGFFDMAIYALTPDRYQLEIRNGKTKQFSFKLLDSLMVENIEIMDRRTHEKENIPFLQNGPMISFSYEFKKIKNQMIDIYVNNRLITSYRCRKNKN